MPEPSAAAGRRRLLTGALLALALAVALAVGWSLLAPTPPVRDRDGLLLSPLDPEFSAGQLSVFALLAVAAGLLHGALVLLGRAARRPVAGLAVVGAAAVGSMVAWRLGVLLGPAPVAVQQAAGDDLVAPLSLGSLGVLGLWPATTAAVLFAGLLISGLRSPLPPDGGSAAGDAGGPGPGQGDQVGGGQLDVQAPPPGRDQDGR